MFAAVGIAGLYALQAATGRKPGPRVDEHVGSNPKLAGQQQQDLPNSPAKLQRPHSLAQIVKHGAIVCLKNVKGDLVVVQPCGTGKSQWQLAVTCAGGGCVNMSQGRALMSYVAADALFLVCQVDNSNTFAFRSLGAEGRYLAAHRELKQGPAIEQHKITAASQWRVAGSCLKNVQHSHKVLEYSVHVVKAVPVDAITATEHTYDRMLDQQQSKIVLLENSNKQLDSKVQHLTQQLVTDRREHAEQVEQLTQQLGRWKQAAKELDANVRQEQRVNQQLQQAVCELQDVCKSNEQELGTAYQEIARLQEQLAQQEQMLQQEQQDMQQAFASEIAERDAMLHQYTTEAKQWGRTREKLEAHLHQKDEEIATLSEQVQRLDHALREVQRLMCGNTRRHRLDRESLDAVSIHQLQAAVAQFAAQGDCLMDTSPGRNLRESQALQKLLASHVSDGSNVSADSTDDVQQRQQQQQTQLAMRGAYSGTHTSTDARDFGSCDQSRDLPSVGLLAAAVDSPDPHDSPLIKLAASSSSGSFMRGSKPGALASRCSVSGSQNRPPAAPAAGSSLSAGANWLAAAAAAGSSCKDANSWPAAGPPSRHQLRTGSGTSSRMGSTAGAAGAGGALADALHSGTWGMTDVGVSGSSRRTNTSAASEEHGIHRYSCSEGLSDADSDSQTGDEVYQQQAAAEELDDDDLNAIHSVGQSLEEEVLRQTISMARQQQQQPEQDSPATAAIAAAAAAKQLAARSLLSRSSSGTRHSISSLPPVKEEQHTDKAAPPGALTVAKLRERMAQQPHGGRANS